MIFYLGTHCPAWLERLDFADAPLFVSRRRLANRRALPRAVGTWALDSGGFSELSLFGEWRTSAEQYAAEVARFAREIGGLAWAAIQDWMCEPFMLVKTGLSLAEHQARTIRSYLDLSALAPDLPWAPVLQGWVEADYLRHADAYEVAGVALAALPVVGIGSVCRRQDTEAAAGIVARLAQRGYRLHGFGVKVGGLRRAAPYLASADSMAWSFGARRDPPLDGCTHKNCANCPHYARRWYDAIRSELDSGLYQLRLVEGRSVPDAASELTEVAVA